MILTPELAELAGIHAGDGYLRYEGKRKELEIIGGFEDRQYYDQHIVPLIQQEFKIPVTARDFNTKSTYGIILRNVAVLDAFKKMGFPSGTKFLTARVPEFIRNTDDKALISAFLRGFFDTDGALFFMRRTGTKYAAFKRVAHYYPRIMLGGTALGLIDDISKLLKKLGIKHTRYTRELQPPLNRFAVISIAGRKMLEVWMNGIGCKNPAKYSRYLVWKKLGFCPPETTFEQRQDLLKVKK